jgi:hypothetical protein
MPSWNQRVASPQQPQLAPLAPQFPIQQNWWRIIGWPFFVVLAIGIFEPALAMLSLGLAFILSARITVGTQYVRKLFAGLMLSAFALWMANQAIISGVLDWDYTLPSTLFRLLCIIAAVGTPVAVYMAQTKQRQGY